MDDRFDCIGDGEPVVGGVTQHVQERRSVKVFLNEVIPPGEISLFKNPHDLGMVKTLQEHGLTLEIPNLF